MKTPWRVHLWRLVVTIFHRWPIHPGWRHPLRFYEFGCILCRYQFRQMAEYLNANPFPDRSEIVVSEPTYDAEGKLVRRGVRMSATVKRQLDKIMADPAGAEAVTKAIDQIARDKEDG